MCHRNFNVISHMYTCTHAHTVDNKLHFSNIDLKMYPTLIHVGKEVPNNSPGGTTEGNCQLLRSTVYHLLYTSSLKHVIKQHKNKWRQLVSRLALIL